MAWTDEICWVGMFAPIARGCRLDGGVWVVRLNEKDRPGRCCGGRMGENLQ